MKRVRLSRRRILQLAAAMPVVGTAAVGADAAGYCPPSLPSRDIPEDAMSALVEKATEHNPNLQEGEFRCIANELWHYFQLGAEHGGLPVPDNSTTDRGKKETKLRLVKGTFFARNSQGKHSGELIVDRMRKWDQLRESSNVCAFLCGEKAATLALEDAKNKKNPDPQIDLDVYERAFRDTEIYMTTLMQRLRQISGSEHDMAGSC